MHRAAKIRWENSLTAGSQYFTVETDWHSITRQEALFMKDISLFEYLTYLQAQIEHLVYRVGEVFHGDQAVKESAGFLS